MLKIEIKVENNRAEVSMEGDRINIDMMIQGAASLVQGIVNEAVSKAADAGVGDTFTADVAAEFVLNDIKEYVKTRIVSKEETNNA